MNNHHLPITNEDLVNIMYKLAFFKMKGEKYYGRNTRLIVLVVLSTRPEAVKIAPLIHKMYQYDEIKTIVSVISEPNQMMYPLLDQFQIRPDYNFNIMSTDNLY